MPRWLNFKTVCVTAIVSWISLFVFLLAAGYPFAWLISRSGPRVRPVLLLMVIIPFWTSSLIRTYALIIMLKA
ncbi:MAG: spermidine/putrescine ABC transporter permease PotB, partial [Pseudomonadota bacterium]